MTEQTNNSKDLTLFKILGWISTAVSLLFVPILFGAGGVICGYLLRSKGQVQYGTIMMIAAVACGFFGVVFVMAVAGY